MMLVVYTAVVSVWGNNEIEFTYGQDTIETKAIPMMIALFTL